MTLPVSAREITWRQLPRSRIGFALALLVGANLLTGLPTYARTVLSVAQVKRLCGSQESATRIWVKGYYYSDWSTKYGGANYAVRGALTQRRSAAPPGLEGYPQSLRTGVRLVIPLSVFGPNTTPYGPTTVVPQGERITIRGVLTCTQSYPLIHVDRLLRSPAR